MAVATSTAILIGAAVAAGTTSYFGKKSLDNAADQRKAQDKLEAQRKKEIADQAAARAAQEKEAETSGQRAGRTGFMSGLGFGSGNTTAGLGSGNLFGN